MSIFSYIPLAPKKVKEPELEENYSKDLKVRARAIEPKASRNVIFGHFYKRNRNTQFEESPFDFRRIGQAIDTDSYVKQAFAKYEDLFWKEGWEITGQNEEAVKYVWKRISDMEDLMGTSFQSFLTEVVNELLKYSNVFIAIARSTSNPNQIAGFYIIPTECVKIRRDKFNRPIAYSQELTDQTKGEPTKSGNITWPASDVIHLHLYRKPGRAFGTPFIEAVLDDVISLRQLEEDILNLTHRELFPLYLYKVGTDQMPAMDGELDLAIGAIEDLKAEGGLVAPGNHSVEVLGAEGNSLEVNEYLTHFKERVAIGLGVSPHHLGMMSGTSNRSVTERLDLALYDKVKQFQRYIEDSLRLHVLKPILKEGGFSPSAANLDKHDNDTCFFKFKEIDIQTQIAKENHYTDLFLKNVISWTEARERMQLPESIDDPEQMHMVMMAKIQAYQTMMASQGQDSDKPDAQKPAAPGQINMPNFSKGTSNKDRPINQHGRRESPKIRREDYKDPNSFIENFSEFIDKDE